MLRIAAENNITILVLRIMDRIDEVVFAVLHAAGLEAVDVLPGLRVCKGEVVGCDADDCAVLAVEAFDVVG
jgi:hypothetical protein